MFMHGARIGFFSGDVKLLTNDMQALRPTIFPTVPRLLNRMYDKVSVHLMNIYIYVAFSLLFGIFSFNMMNSCSRMSLSFKFDFK